MSESPVACASIHLHKHSISTLETAPECLPSLQFIWEIYMKSKQVERGQFTINSGARAGLGGVVGVGVNYYYAVLIRDCHVWAWPKRCTD